MFIKPGIAVLVLCFLRQRAVSDHSRRYWCCRHLWAVMISRGMEVTIQRSVSKSISQSSGTWIMQASRECDTERNQFERVACDESSPCRATKEAFVAGLEWRARVDNQAAGSRER